MLCEKCQSNEATLHLTRIVDGQAGTVHLCTDCARSLGLALPSSPMDMESFLQRLFGLQAPPHHHVAPPRPPADAAPDDDASGDTAAPPCPACGTPFDRIDATGFAGCPVCQARRLDADDAYPPFRTSYPSVPPLRVHFGKLPRTLSRAERNLAERHRLAARLELATRDERFEEAAELRARLDALPPPPPDPAP
ncbi:MAG: hypothetical protein IK066_00490 [Kiritimatiellae bacterium]|nr:hypothetical protein [Kiritimatiellia bacterium]